MWKGCKNAVNKALNTIYSFLNGWCLRVNNRNGNEKQGHGLSVFNDGIGRSFDVNHFYNLVSSFNVAFK